MNNIAYFDNAATTKVKPKQVHDFMYEFYSNNSINVGRGNYSAQGQSINIIKETRQMLLQLFHGNNSYEAIFMPTATEAINTILFGTNLNEGDTIYISPFEHNAVYRAVKHLEKTKRIRVEILSYNEVTYDLDFDKIRMQFAGLVPDMVVATHVSNVFGKILDIKTLGQIVKKYKCKYLIDCSQSAGLLDTNIVECQADYMVFAGHKTLYGPFGCSGFIGLKESAPEPLIYGGTGVDSANEDMPRELPTRFEAGSINIMAISGLYSALKWNNAVGINNIKQKEKINYDRLKELISRYPFMHIVGDVENCTSIVSCVCDNYSPDNIGDILSRNNVFVRTGLHCAPLAHKTLGTFPAGTIRFSVSYFTSDDDFKALEEVLDLIEEE